jgi:hypothetical protein
MPSESPDHRPDQNLEQDLLHELLGVRLPIVHDATPTSPPDAVRRSPRPPPRNSAILPTPHCLSVMDYRGP